MPSVKFQSETCETIGAETSFHFTMFVDLKRDNIYSKEGRSNTSTKHAKCVCETVNLVVVIIAGVENEGKKCSELFTLLNRKSLN